MGAQIQTRQQGGASGEASGLVEIEGCALHGSVIEGSEIPNVIDEIPVLAVAGALAEGKTIIRDASELRVKESDRLAVVCQHLRAMGAQVEEMPDGMVIEGGHPLRGAVLDSHGDHRIAMAFAIAGLFAEGKTVITDTSCVETSYPGFAAQLKELANG
jgi:3-phosphoshikimate 1-carboxyvinyltransferase